MKAVVYTEYGPPDVLQIEEVEKPTPNENQVMIKVHAASVNAGDYRVMRANPFLVRLMTGGLLKPKNTRLGSDVAGGRGPLAGDLEGDQLDDAGRAAPDPSP